jgi:GTP pyrophosphokinase
MDIAELIRKAKGYAKVDEAKLKRAYEFAEKAHAGQQRMSGEPYITHPLGVAMITAKYGADEESLIAALLHDVVEDTSHTLKEIEEGFGKGVAKMVDALTKLPHVNTKASEVHDEIDTKVESLRKIFAVMQEDVRVIVIKLCDRLHNMQSLGAFRPEKQRRIAQETLDIFVKIADRLCIGELKSELEDLSYRYLLPEFYAAEKEREQQAKDHFSGNQKRINEKLRKIGKSAALTEVIFHPHLSFPESRPSSPQNSDIVYDIILVLPREEDCFLRLKDLHQTWNNIRGTFRDYITLPRSNGYQALETSVVKTDGTVLRFILQTPAMLEYANKGVITECFSQQPRVKKIHLPWIEHLKKIHQETKDKSIDYMEALENDILKGWIISYTDDNKRLYLPQRSTALDAAFLRLGKEAYRLRKVLVDQHEVQFSHRLKDWQTIHFELSPERQIDAHWLSWVQTSYAKSLVYDHLRQLSRQRQHQVAEKLLQQELHEIGFGYLEEVSLRRRMETAKKLGVSDWNGVLESICTGRQNTQTVIRYLFDQVIFSTKMVNNALRLQRSNGPDGIIPVLQYFQENKISFQHLETRRVGQVFVDEFKVDWTLAQRAHFFSFVKEFLHFELSELRPLQLSIIPYAYALAVPFFWAINTFVTRYLLGQGLSVENATELRFASSTVALFTLAYFVRRHYREDYSPLQFSWWFFFIGLVLAAYTYLIHLTLYYTVSINYILPVSISFILIGLIHAGVIKLRQHHLAMMMGVLALCALAMAALFWQPLSDDAFWGIMLGLGVSFLHMTYNYFGNQYQRENKIQSRSILFVAQLFLVASVVFLPFVDLDNLTAASAGAIALAIINGITTGGISHFFFFESSRLLHHYKVTALMSLMVVFTVLMGILWDQSINYFHLIATFIMVGAFGLTAFIEKREQFKSRLT